MEFIHDVQGNDVGEGVRVQPGAVSPVDNCRQVAGGSVSSAFLASTLPPMSPSTAFAGSGANLPLAFKFLKAVAAGTQIECDITVEDIQRINHHRVGQAEEGEASDEETEEEEA